MRGHRLNIAGLADSARAHGWTVQILAMPADLRTMRSLLELWRPDGVVGGLQFVGMQAFASVPLVVIASPGNRPPGYARYVENDPVPTVSLAVEELRRLRYPDYAFAGACTDEPWCAERKKAFRAALARYGLGCRSFFPDARQTEDAPARHRALRAWLAALPKPCALLAANDTVGRSVLAAARALGVRVPDDLAVCAVDNDTETCLHASPTLTSVEPDFLRRRLPRRGAPRPPGRSAEMRFRRATGMSIQEAILAERVETAKALMRRPGLKLEAVAALSGWKTYSVFRRHFTAACGLPPSDWRAARATAAPS